MSDQVTEAISLLKNIPESYRVYEENNDHEDFAAWFDMKPEFLRSSIATAIHETVHNVRAKKGKHLTLFDGFVPTYEHLDDKMPKPGDIIMPEMIKHKMENNHFVTDYLADGEETGSSRDYFSYLLDEFNSYIHDVYVFNKLESLPINSVPLDGLAAFMCFVSIYISKVGMTNIPKEHHDVINIMWTTAEKVFHETSEPEKKGIDYKKWFEIMEQYK